jgi:hypothetical protein
MSRKRASALICHERKRRRHKTATIFIGGSTAAAGRRGRLKTLTAGLI